MSMDDLHLAMVDQEEEYSRLAGMFYVDTSGTDDNMQQAPSSGDKAQLKTVSSSGNLQQCLELPRSPSKSPLIHSRSAPMDLKQLSSAETIQTPPSPSYQPIHEAFSTWDDAPVTPPNRGVAKDAVLQKYEVQEKKFCERFLSGGDVNVSGYSSPHSPMSPVSDGTSSLDVPEIKQYVAGTDHLGNLVKLLEQLSVLHEQNTVLRKKCAYLEDVKTLLKSRTLPAEFVPMDSPKERKGESLITRAQTKVMHYLSTPSSNGTMRRESRVTSDSSADGRPRTLRSRSQSVGSIDMVEDLTPVIKPAPSNHRNSETPKSPNTKSATLRLHSSSSKKHGKRFSKWMRVKKVFSGKHDHQSKSVDGGGGISAEQLVRSNSKHSSKLTHMKSVDDGLLNPRENAKADIPPSPSSVQSEPNSFANDDDDYEDYEEYVETHPPHSSSTPSTDGFPTLRTMPRLKDTDPPQVSLSDSEQADTTDKQTLQRRKSSPTLGFFRQNDEEPFSRGSISRLSRSSSLIETAGRDQSQSPEKTQKSAWNKVKDIIHTRKDSLKKTRKAAGRSLSTGETGGTDADSEISPDSSSWEGRAPLNTEIDPQSPVAKAANVAGVVAATAPTPKLVRRYTTKASSSRSQSPQIGGSGRRRRGGSVKGTPDSPATVPRDKRESVSVLGSSPPVDVSALMGKLVIFTQ